MRESQFTALVRKDLDREIYALKLSLRYGAGVADNWYSGVGGDLWVEYKFYNNLPKNINLCEGATPKLTKLQQQWLSARLREGRNVAVVVGCGQGAIILKNLEWLLPISREEFLTRCTTRRAIAEWIENECLKAMETEQRCLNS